MKKYILTHGTRIISCGALGKLTKELEKEKKKIEKKKLEIIAYIRGKKLIYVNKENENCMWEII